MINLNCWDVGNNQIFNFILTFSSLGLLLIGYLDNGIYTTFVTSSHKLRDTNKEHTRMHELRIANGPDGYNHNEAEHIHWDI